jgi:AbrB family looped-hinge helix DNA binding protein
MHACLTIDTAGKVVIPELLRKELNLNPGDSLEMDSVGDRITLRPLRVADRLVKEHGIWVIDAGDPLTVEQTEGILSTIRGEREPAA